jgi:hypothetical protein
MMKKLIFVLISLFISNLSYASNCFTREEAICKEEAKEEYINSGKQYTCVWYPDNVYPFYGICVLVKVNK